MLLQKPYLIVKISSSLSTHCPRSAPTCWAIYAVLGWQKIHKCVNNASLKILKHVLSRLKTIACEL